MKAQVLPVNERLFTAGMAPRPFEIVFAETIFALIADMPNCGRWLKRRSKRPKMGQRVKQNPFKKFAEIVTFLRSTIEI